MNKKENGTIDIAKFVFSLLIVSIHTQPFIDCSEVFNCYFENVFSRMAVCLFFVISGYYFFKGIDFENGKIKKSKGNRKKLLRYVVRVSVLYTVWSIIYLLLMIPEWYETGWFSFNAFLDFGISFFFKQSYYHLWFLLSLIYAIPIMYFVLRFIKLKFFAIVSLIIYIFGVLSDSYSFIGLPINVISQTMLSVFPRLRTVIFCVIPLISISLLVDKINISAKKSISLALCFFTGYSVEAMLIYSFTENKDNFTYLLLTIPTALLMFSALKMINIEIKNGYLLRKSSTIIYCVHPLIINLFQLIINHDEINSLLYFAIVAVTSMLISFLLIAAYKNIRCCKFIKYIM